MPKIIFLILFAFAGCVSAQIQPPTFEWAKSFGGWNDDYVTDMGVDDAGNVYVCGEFKGFMCFDTICIFSQLEDTSDIFLAKYDSLGNVIWAKAFGGRWVDGKAKMEVSSSGEIYLAGQFSDSIVIDSYILYAKDPNFYFYGGPDSFIAKLNTDGVAEWVIHPGTSQLQAIYLKNRKLYIAGGLHTDSLKFHDTIIKRESENQDTYLAKLNSDGQIVFIKIFGALAHHHAGVSAICVNDKEEIFIAGPMKDTLFLSPIKRGKESRNVQFIAALDSIGNAKWVQLLSSNIIGNYAIIDELFIISSNMIIGVGQAKGTFSRDYVNYHVPSTYYLMLGSSFDGDSVWLSTYPGLFSISQSYSLNNQAYICGTAWSNLIFDDRIITISPNQSSEVVILRHDSTGQLVWGKALSSPAQDAGIGICGNAKGNLYVAGGFFDFDTLIDSLVVSNSWGGSFEPWVGRMTRDSFYVPPPPPPPNPISPIWQVFPNPFMDSLYVSGKFNPPLQLTLFDIQGRLIWESSIQPPISPTRIPISVPELSPALYILVLQSKDQRVAYKLLKQV